MEINNIVIAGAGIMGSSMAQIYAKYFDNVTLYNHREESLKKAQNRIRENVETLVKSGELERKAADKLLGSITYTTSTDCFKSCDCVAENLTESMEIKDEFYKMISAIIKDDAIITTNTSGLSINRLSQSVKKPERFIGMHWFNPPHLVPLIEIIKGDNTKEDVARTIYQLALKIEKKPVIVNKDVSGFVANRLQFAVLREALELVRKGVVSSEGIDAVMKYGLGFRYACLGPLEVVDLGGIDTFYHISEYLCEDLCNSKEPPELLKEHYAAGEYGVKSKKGFYDYSDGKDTKTIAERDEKFLKLYHALYS